MARYFFHRHNIQHYHRRVFVRVDENINFIEGSTNNHVSGSDSLYQNYNIQGDQFVGVGYISETTLQGAIRKFSIAGGRSWRKSQLTGYRFRYYDDNFERYMHKYRGNIYDLQPATRAGRFLMEVIGGNINSYPANGPSGGYWYIRQGPVPAPRAPVILGFPGTAKGGYPFRLNWESSERATSYEVQRSIDDGNYTTIYEGSDLNYVDWVSKDWFTVSYRVRAWNTHEGYGGYATTSNALVESMPNLDLRIRGLLRQSKQGWTRKETVLRDFDRIWVKINGELIEL